MSIGERIYREEMFLIPYRPIFKKITGSVTAAILLQRIIELWEKSGGTFLKFKQPCKHSFYRKGDSWCEELGFSVDEFNTALKKLEVLGFVEHKVTIGRETYYSLDRVVMTKALDRRRAENE